MKVTLLVTMMWTMAVVLSGILSVMITDTTLKRKYSLAKTTLSWAGLMAGAYLLSLLSYSVTIANDTVGIIGTSAIVWAGGILLYERHVSSRLFVSIMATLIANVSTFFFCGTTLSFIDHTANPYNVHTIGIFIGIKLVWFTIFYLVYVQFLRQIIIRVLDAMDGRMEKYLPIPILSFIGFYGINWITNQIGVLPGVPAMRYYFIALYGIICLVFVLEFWEIFSSVFWSSRALKTEAELNVASTIQQDMLPCIFPAFPDYQEFDVYATMQPAKEVGGDFYDFFLVDERHLGFVIADVSGKGVPAALFMVIAKTLIKNHAQNGEKPEEVFNGVNNQLCENNEAGMFVTAWMGVLDIDTGTIIYVNAGHNPPLIRRKGGEFEYLKGKPGFVLAGMEEMIYHQQELQFNHGDTIYLYTDGVTEATDSHNELFGEERLKKALDSAQEMELIELLPYVKEEIDNFVKEAPQFDDITMLGLRFGE